MVLISIGISSGSRSRSSSSGRNQLLNIIGIVTGGNRLCRRSPGWLPRATTMTMLSTGIIQGVSTSVSKRYTRPSPYLRGWYLALTTPAASNHPRTVSDRREEHEETTFTPQQQQWRRRRGQNKVPASTNEFGIITLKQEGVVP